MINPIIYIVMNKSLKMSPGKVASQAVHAFAALQNNHDLSEFYKERKRTVIVLEAESEDQIKNIEEYLYDLNIPSEYYIDEGVNEISSYSVTALAVSPIESHDFEKREIFKDLKLYGKNKNKRKWIKLWLK